MKLAEDMGMVVERRPVPLTDVGSFKEVAACGTAVVMTSIKQIVAGGEVSVESASKRSSVLASAAIRHCDGAILMA